MALDSRRLAEGPSPKVLREARLRLRDEKWLSAGPAYVLSRCRGKYVAVRNKNIVAASPTMKELYAKIDKLDPGMVLIIRIEKPTLLVYPQFCR